MNNSRYGLASGVVTNDLTRAQRMSRQLQAGVVFVNDYQIMDTTAPFGGVKDSGLGRELGAEGLTNYQEIKSVIIKKWSLQSTYFIKLL